MKTGNTINTIKDHLMFNISLLQTKHHKVNIIFQERTQVDYLDAAY